MLHKFVQHQGMDVVVDITGQLASFGASVRAMSTRFEIVVNGETRSVAEGTTVTGLIAELGFADRRVAIERNREVVPRAQHATTVLAAGDRLEVVTFVGGG
jgi:sulfur carrier protein